KCRMKNVPGTCRVCDGNTERRGVVKLIAVPCQDAVAAECRRRQSSAEPRLQERERLHEISPLTQLFGKAAADKQVINVGKKIVDCRVSFVQIGDDRRARFVRPRCSDGSSGSVIAIHQKGPRTNNPFAFEFLWLERKPVV